MRLERHGQPAIWLTERPIAHRGLHGAANGIPENSVSAARAAIERRFAIECDVQCTADGEAVVFHDFTLDRLTAGTGAIAALPSAALADLRLTDSNDRIPTFTSFLDHIAGAVPLICEIKSRFEGDMRLTDRVAEVLRDYSGPVAVKSFDPAVVIHLRGRGFGRPLGICSEATFEDPEWDDLSPALRRSLAQVLHFAESQPDFLSFCVNDLPHAVPYLCRSALDLPVMAWTVRTPEQRERAAAWADQMVFEGFVP